MHLLVKHRGSRRPSSWKSPQITRTKEEALEMLASYRQRIESGEVRGVGGREGGSESGEVRGVGRVR